MRLTTIKLSGFKSFVVPTTLHLPSNMTGIVGPNGCGKSNIIDAIRWVMGESAASRLRGDNLSDVIFSGSGGRKPVGTATVELVFDNSEGLVGGEYARFSEITVKRSAVATGVLLSIRRRYFRDQPVWMTVAAVLLLGTANLGCYLLSQANIYQAAIAAGMCFSVGAIYFLVRAFERTPRRTAYLVAASLFLGLAAGARPHFAVTSVLLLGISAFTLWRSGDRQPIRFAAVSAPLVAIGGFLGLYNFLRFGSFFEFGAKYHLGIVDMRNVGMFGLDHVPSTLYFMFFQPPTFNGEFPYVHPMPSLPAWLLKPKVFILERVTGLFMATPFLWMLFPAAALAFARRDRQTETAKRPALELAFVGAFMGFVIFVLSFTCGTMRPCSAGPWRRDG